MNKYTFIKSETLSRIGILTFVSWLFGFTFISFLIALVTTGLCFLFRRRQIDLSELRLSEELLVMSPISGKNLHHNKIENQLSLKMKLSSGFGVYMPITGEVTDFKEEFVKKNRFITSYASSLTLEDGQNNIFVLSFTSKLHYFRPRIAVRAGDRGKLGATIGYLPFGGNVLLDFDDKSKVTFQAKDRLIATQTVVANIEEKV